MSLKPESIPTILEMTAMDGVIDVLECWSNGEIDGTQLASEFYEAEQRLDEARETLRQ